MLKLALVFGTRPEAIKMAPLVKACQGVAGWDTRVIVTGQHREMVDQVLELFDLEAHYDLNIMSHGQTLNEISERTLRGMAGIFREWRPDLVLVHGDTSTAFAAALAAFHERIPVGHVEAGLRTPSVQNPFPEEANRRLIDVLAHWYFAPTERAAENLRLERVDPDRIFVTGNTVIDALLSVVEKDFEFTTPELRRLDFNRPILVVTAHRRENWGEPLTGICQALLEISARSQMQIVVAMHKNPDIQAVMKGFLGSDANITLVDAPGYKEFANLLARCTLLLTDSGGLQEEAPALHKPVLVMREVTERPEALEAGTVKLVGSAQDSIVTAVLQLLSDAQLYQRMSTAPNPYGDGTAALRICAILQEKYK
ncbi:MAG: non-hydrolyzing UDP-N-acetylglucosamine 2-epimerase [Limnochordia bacterium]|jgi:UDP-N-acetylglucosamine 2-epimerase (non-hydrolysing)|nr:UDP-N-acetylglucosamine 2-epimerase (non-hydrolyzing) [Bacillota bacterium]NLL07446.1 UDP-N-acetylglucosamine 2-epimerase (non-hydrolyzing) [Bacillota bacterium]HBG08907.1 UDP-N-acetylglucosamine 2-epimerase (non-hydrolyzing) [Bacillota bacterium]